MSSDCYCKLDSLEENESDEEREASGSEFENGDSFFLVSVVCHVGQNKVNHNNNI